LTSAQEPDFEAKVADICALYQQAPTLAEQGERVVSTDELTGVQALERAHPGLPMVPGKVERREFEYIRHGTTSFMITRDVVSGLVLVPASGPTRTAADFLAHLQQVVATDAAATRWHFVADNLNIHLSTPLVRYVAAVSGVTEELGEPGKRGILRTRHTRAAFLADSSHRIVFHYPPSMPPG
jgi:DDE superfamily endonuclease